MEQIRKQSKRKLNKLTQKRLVAYNPWYTMQLGSVGSFVAPRAAGPKHLDLKSNNSAPGVSSLTITDEGGNAITVVSATDLVMALGAGSDGLCLPS